MAIGLNSNFTTILTSALDLSYPNYCTSTPKGEGCSTCPMNKLWEDINKADKSLTLTHGRDCQNQLRLLKAILTK